MIDDSESDRLYGSRDWEKASPPRKHLYIQVEDTGWGMDKKHLSDLFTKFGTGNNTNGLNANGLGLGLYLSKEIWQKLGGDIVWKSQKGKGSTFIINLPFDSLYELKNVFDKPRIFDFSTFRPKPLSIQDALSDDFEEFTDFETKDGLSFKFKDDWILKTTRSRFRRNPNKIKYLESYSSIEDLSDSEITPIKEKDLPQKYELDLVQEWAWIKILVVDDLAFNLLAVETVLKRKFNITIDKAFSGEEAIKKVEKKKSQPCWKTYSLILMDYYMPPGINGAEASVKIKNIEAKNGECKIDSYIVWLTSQGEGDFEFSEGLKNFDQVIPKPINHEELKELLVKLFQVKES